MKTVNLELSKQLKEAGYPQEGFLRWVEAEKINECTYFEEEENFVLVAGKDYAIVLKKEGGCEEYYSPTADEILEQLPDLIASNEYGDGFLEIEKHSKDGRTITRWKVLYRDVKRRNLFDPTYELCLADAAAKMWLYLKKEGLL